MYSAAPTTDALALAAHLRANPTDDAAWLAYADEIHETHPYFAIHIRVIRGLPYGLPITAFGGHLQRVGPDQYQWSDGTPEPRARDVSINAHNFRANGSFVEVPLQTARHPRNPDLRWVAEGRDLHWYHATGYPRLVAHVPLAEWDADAAALPAGIEWDLRDEAGIIAKARAFGAVVSDERVPFGG